MDEATAHAMQYLTLTDAMGYKAGPQELSPEEFADALRKDALLGRFVRLHMVELGGGWQINQTFIPGAPSLEDVTDALDPLAIAAMQAR